jgi:hypothetical protein
VEAPCLIRSGEGHEVVVSDALPARDTVEPDAKDGTHTGRQLAVSCRMRHFGCSGAATVLETDEHSGTRSTRYPVSYFRLAAVQAKILGSATTRIIRLPI